MKNASTTIEETLIETARKIGSAVDEFRDLLKTFVAEDPDCLTPKEIADMVDKRVIQPSLLIHMLDCQRCSTLFKTYHASTR